MSNVLLSFLKGAVNGAIGIANENPPSSTELTDEKATAAAANAINQQSNHPVQWRMKVARQVEVEVNDRDKDTGRTDSNNTGRDWSQDSRFAEAQRLRELGDVFERGAVERAEEAIGDIRDLRVYTGSEQLIEALNEKQVAREYYNVANNLENQVAQDASHENVGSGDSGCIIA